VLAEALPPFGNSCRPGIQFGSNLLVGMACIRQQNDSRSFHHAMLTLPPARPLPELAGFFIREAYNRGLPTHALRIS
jgi:hypothetical protein